MEIVKASEWDSEPDYEDGVFFGLPCFIRRHAHFKTLNGYVGVDKTNPYFEKEYGGLHFDVHGGLTFSSGGTHGVFGYQWWFGFDCGHVFDFQPGMFEHYNSIGVGCSPELTRIYSEGIYRNIEYVRDQCVGLASQLSTKLNFVNIDFESKPDPKLLRLVND